VIRNTDMPAGWLRALVIALTVLAWLVLAVLCLWVLGHFTRTILLIVLAAILAFAFTPMANFIQHWAPRPVSIGVAYLIGVAIIFGCGAYIVATTVAQVSSLVASIPEYAMAAQSLQPRLEALVAPLGVPSTWISDTEQQLIGEIQVAGTEVARDLLPRLAEFFGTIVDVVFVMILSIYFALDGARIADWLKTQTPGDRTRARAGVLVAVVNRVVGGYIRGVLTLALLIGLLVGVGMAVLGVPYAVLLGVLAFFMEFVPVLGVFISGVAAVAVAAVHFGDVIHPTIVLAYFIIIHVIEGDVVGPRILGRAVGIHPATGLIALVAGTEVFGIWGALFAAPLAGLAQAILAAAWVEFRGGHPQEVLDAVTAEATDSAERKVSAT
jgi:predicted PurR-regulated permease PerM